MKTIKEFWDYKCDYAWTVGDGRWCDSWRLEQGMFFWERGGKQFVLSFNEYSNSEEIKDYISDANSILIDDEQDDIKPFDARDFLDCLDCLGEEKVKELIKELKKVSKNE